MKEIVELLDVTPLPGDRWLTAEEAARLIGKSTRVVQKMAHDGILTWKLAGRKSHPNARLYDPQDLQHHLSQTSPSRIGATTSAVAVRPPKPRPEERGLEVPHVLGNMMASHMKEQQAFLKAQDVFLKQLDVQANNAAKNLENITATLAKNLENVVGQIFAAQRADREDALHRFELERKYRQENLARRAGNQGESALRTDGKARKAHAAGS